MADPIFVAVLTFKQGDDALLQLRVTETVPIDFTTAEEIKVMLFSGTTEIAKFSLNVATGYAPLTVSGTTNGLVMPAERELTIDFPVGAINAYVLAKFPSGSFPDNNQVRSWEVLIGRCLAGKALDKDI